MVRGKVRAKVRDQAGNGGAMKKASIHRRATGDVVEKVVIRAGKVIGQVWMRAFDSIITHTHDDPISEGQRPSLAQIQVRGDGKKR